MGIFKSPVLVTKEPQCISILPQEMVTSYILSAIYSPLESLALKASLGAELPKKLHFHSSLICGDECLLFKYYGHKDFTDFYFMLNVYPLLANDKLKSTSCSGISAWR